MWTRQWKTRTRSSVSTQGLGLTMEWKTAFEGENITDLYEKMVQRIKPRCELFPSEQLFNQSSPTKSTHDVKGLEMNCLLGLQSGALILGVQQPPLMVSANWRGELYHVLRFNLDLPWGGERSRLPGFCFTRLHVCF